MAKKDFTGMTTGRVYGSIETATTNKGQQGSASPEEQTERAQKLRTQGRKGCKATRINMAFSPDNYEFIRVMARISGKTMTEFTNFALEKYREEHPGAFEKAKEIIDTL